MNVLNFFGLPYYLSDFYSLSRRSLKDVVEVSQNKNSKQIRYRMYDVYSFNITVSTL